MRRPFGEALRTPRHVVASGGSRGGGRTARHRIVALVDVVDGASIRRQGWLALLQRRRRRRCRRRRARLSVSGSVAVALATTTPCGDDLATVLTPHRLRDQPQVHALPANGQHSSAVAGTPVHPQLAIPSDVGDSPTATSSSFLHPLSVIETELGLASSTNASRRRRIADEAMWK